MKNQVIIRVILIGIFHAVLYLYVVPFHVYPKFGQNGLKFSIILAIIISIATLGTIKLNNYKGDKNE